MKQSQLMNACDVRIGSGMLPKLQLHYPDYSLNPTSAQFYIKLSKIFWSLVLLQSYRYPLDNRQWAKVGSMLVQHGSMLVQHNFVQCWHTI